MKRGIWAILYILGLELLLFSTNSWAEEKFKIAQNDQKELAINGPRIVGTTPGRPFLFLIPATGEAPLSYSANNLPKGLKLDSKTGIITGSLEEGGAYVVELMVKGARGIAMRNLVIVGGKNKLALTPPMGWNSWNVWGCAVDEDKVRQAIDAMVSTGLANYGYQYVNIDDCWMNGRNENGEIIPNEKFPDIKALADYAHSKGLKLGIYSSPGPKTCQRQEGSYGHERQDAETYAQWGIDYLKYDWCSYHEVKLGLSRSYFKKPYIEMKKHLEELDRDIVYSICQYGMAEVWEWGETAGGNLWRTTGDIWDSWRRMSGIGFKQHKLSRYAGPGHWNDPDMLVVGKLGWGPHLHQTKLSPDEQITHITLWSLLSAPLLLGCDLTALDEFTLTLLTNPEVIDIDQDPLGKQATRVLKIGETELWKKELWDGTIALGLFNRGELEKEASVKWSELGISGVQPVRDLWQRKDLGDFAQGLSVLVPKHGAVLLKVGKPKKTDFEGY